MAPSPDLLQLATEIIASCTLDDIDDDPLAFIQRLIAVLPETVVIAALDLLDRQNVIKHTADGCYPQYEVLGTTATYTVFLDMSIAMLPFYCTCPAFAYTVLLSESHTMCKHVLAAMLANQLALFIERPMTREDLQSKLSLQFTAPILLL